jgi:hypothetical protein
MPRKKKPAKKNLKRMLKAHPDVATLMSHLSAEDPLALVIRGHLYVENALIKKIEDALTDPTAFDSARLHFPSKVSLAVALGTVDRADVVALTALNGLRVQFAHNVDTKLTDQHELNLYNALSRRQRGFVDKLRKPQMTLLVRLRSDIAGLIRTLS